MDCFSIVMRLVSGDNLTIVIGMAKVYEILRLFIEIFYLDKESAAI
jgi:hypothetical protein